MPLWAPPGLHGCDRRATSLHGPSEPSCPGGSRGCQPHWLSSVPSILVCRPQALSFTAMASHGIPPTSKDRAGREGVLMWGPKPLWELQQRASFPVPQPGCRSGPHLDPNPERCQALGKLPGASFRIQQGRSHWVPWSSVIAGLASFTSPSLQQGQPVNFLLLGPGLSLPI